MLHNDSHVLIFTVKKKRSEFESFHLDTECTICYCSSLIFATFLHIFINIITTKKISITSAVTLIVDILFPKICDLE